jgi:acetoin utilization deacetylase AcuC-like enzyme
MPIYGNGFARSTKPYERRVAASGGSNRRMRFDAHVRDPLGGERGTGMRVTTEGYGRIVSKILDVSREAAAGRCVFGLEGGYDLDALTACIEISLTRMVEQRRRSRSAESNR